MPYVQSFMYAESVIGLNMPLANDPTKTEHKIQILGPLSTLKPTYVPGLFSFSFACNILAYDHTIAHTMRLCFLKEGSEVILVDTGVTDISANENTQEDILPPHLRGVNFALDFKNVNIEELGMYITEVYLDDELIGSFPIEVWRKS